MTTRAEANKRPRTGTGRYAPSLATAERDAEYCRMRSRGMMVSEIARHFGVTGPVVSQGISRCLATIRRESAEELVKLELGRLDMMYQAVLDVLERKHYVVSDGRLVYIGDDPIEDDGPILQCVDRLLKIQERRTRYEGLDAPVKSRVEVRTVDSVDAAISDLLRAMDARPARGGA